MHLACPYAPTSSSGEDSRRNTSGPLNGRCSYCSGKVAHSSSRDGTHSGERNREALLAFDGQNLLVEGAQTHRSPIPSKVLSCVFPTERGRGISTHQDKQADHRSPSNKAGATAVLDGCLGERQARRISRGQTDSIIQGMGVPSRAPPRIDAPPVALSVQCVCCDTPYVSDCVGFIVGGISLVHANQLLVDKARRRCTLKNYKAVCRARGRQGPWSAWGILRGERLLRSNNSAQSSSPTLNGLIRAW